MKGGTMGESREDSLRCPTCGEPAKRTILINGRRLPFCLKRRCQKARLDATRRWPRRG